MKEKRSGTSASISLTNCWNCGYYVRQNDGTKGPKCDGPLQSSPPTSTFIWHYNHMVQMIWLSLFTAWLLAHVLVPKHSVVKLLNRVTLSPDLTADRCAVIIIARMNTTIRRLVKTYQNYILNLVSWCHLRLPSQSSEVDYFRMWNWIWIFLSHKIHLQSPHWCSPCLVASLQSERTPG